MSFWECEKCGGIPGVTFCCSEMNNEKEKKCAQDKLCCDNPSQCWEPCGELGKSEQHAKVSDQSFDINQFIERHLAQFRSGNDIDVERAVVTRKELVALLNRYKFINVFSHMDVGYESCDIKEYVGNDAYDKLLLNQVDKS